MTRFSYVLLSMLAAACAATSGTAPHDMGAAEHERAAAVEEKHSRTGARIEEYLERCARGSLATEPGAPCWTAGRDPAAEARRASERQLQLAAVHRASAQALHDAEAGACVGIAGADREVSPFLHTEDIAGVEPLYGRVASRSGVSLKLEGATVTFRAVPGLTAEWLQRVVDCHVARNAVLGYDNPAMAHCPLGLQAVRSTVRSVGAGFAVEMRGDIPTAKQILGRAQALLHVQPSTESPSR